MDPNNQNGQDPSGEPTATGDAQGQTDDPSQAGSAQQAPEPPKYVHQLNGDLKSNEHVLKHQNINDLVSDYVSYAQRADRLVELPGDDADEQTRNQFFEKIRPQSPDEYELPVPDGVEPNKEQEAEFRKLAHEAGLTKQQAAKINEWAATQATQQMQQSQQQRQQAIQALQKEWGDEYQGRIAEVKRAFQEVGGDEFAKYMEQSGESTNPLMVKFFHNVWQKIKPDELVEGSVGAGASAEDAWYPNTTFDNG